MYTSYTDRDNIFTVSGEIGRILENSSFTVAYNDLWKVPNFTICTMVGLEVKIKSRSRMGFRQDRRLPKRFRSKTRDYKKSGYDRGHMVPNAAKDHTYKSQRETFLLTNVTPQDPNLNRRVWKLLEKRIRFMSRLYGIIHVLTGTVLSKNTYIGKHVNVPTQLFKIVVIPKLGRVRCYLLPNKSSVSRESLKNSKYKTTINGINKLVPYEITINS